MIEAFRALRLPAAIRARLGFKQRVSGYSEVTCIETLVPLLAAGGGAWTTCGCCTATRGSKRLWGKSALPAPETLRAFLNGFHDPVVVGGRVTHTAFVPTDSAGLPDLIREGESNTGEGAGWLERPSRAPHLPGSAVPTGQGFSTMSFFRLEAMARNSSFSLGGTLNLSSAATR